MLSFSHDIYGVRNDFCHSLVIFLLDKKILIFVKDRNGRLCRYKKRVS